MKSAEQLIAHSGLPRNEARALLEYATGHSRVWLMAHNDEPLSLVEAQRFVSLCEHRQQGTPLAYLTGNRGFYGRRFHVNSAVLIPRPETEGLVELALRYTTPQSIVIDLGTGSGIIAITLACERADLRIIATDRSMEALNTAHRNATAHNVAHQIDFRLTTSAADWWAPLSAHENVDLVVSNPPYIANTDPHLDIGDLRAEPRHALTDGSIDGLTSIRSICSGASTRLRPGGWLLLEHGFNQAASVRMLLEAAGFSSIVTHCDLAGKERVTMGRLKT